jgi:hypothetical protein
MTSPLFPLVLFKTVAKILFRICRVGPDGDNHHPQQADSLVDIRLKDLSVFVLQGG